MDDGEDVYAARYRAFVNMSGWMNKKTGFLRRRKKRFFRLEGSTLSCSRKRDAPARWEIDVNNCQLVKRDKTLEILVTTNQRKLVLEALSQQEFDKWTEGLQNASCNRITDYYTFGRVIGKGSYGEVIMGTEKSTGESVAIKVMERTDDPQELEFLKREIEVMRSLNHLNLVRTYDIFDNDKKLYIVMEFVPEGDLFDVIAEETNFTEANAAQVMREILIAVQYLHDRGIVHRDIKPENILCVNRTFPLQIKLTDFGFANMSGEVLQTLIGTPFYMAPEVLLQKGHGKPVDIFACGVVLYAMLSGMLPFEEGADGTAVLESIIEGRVSFPDEEWRNVSDAAKDLILQMLSPEAEKRPTATEALNHRWCKEAMQDSKFGKRLDSDLTQLKNKKQGIAGMPQMPQ
mmetsp:Transcript_3749/g.11165  ORF Transcript_3749/g.11165 Transcript_3749/m.11165 type:complete len:403 (-) Transcript_3749:151-1359(-)